MRENPQCEERHSPLVVSLLEPVLLLLLRSQPSHGYTLLSELGAYHMASVHPSVIYRSLREMENLGWIQSSWDTDQTQGPPRRTYRLMPQGEQALQFWKKDLEKTSEIISKLMEKMEQR